MYDIYMARVKVYLPDDLAETARAVGLNVSRLTQEAIRRAVEVQALDRWLEQAASLPRLGIDQEAVEQAMTAAKDEIELGR